MNAKYYKSVFCAYIYKQSRFLSNFRVKSHNYHLFTTASFAWKEKFLVMSKVATLLGSKHTIQAIQLLLSAVSLPVFVCIQDKMQILCCRRTQGLEIYWIFKVAFAAEQNSIILLYLAKKLVKLLPPSATLFLRYTWVCGTWKKDLLLLLFRLD